MKPSFTLINIIGTLEEAGVIRKKPEHHGIIGTDNSLEELDQEEITAFHKATHRSSSVDPQTTLLARQLKLLKDFKVSFDAMARQLRETGDIDEKKFSKLKQICTDPEFDFLMQIPGQYECTGPLQLIIAFADNDPESSINKELCYDSMKVPAARSYTYANAATDIALELLVIAKNKGTEFNFGDNGHPVHGYRGLIENLGISNWFIDNSVVMEMGDTGSLSATIIPKDILKLKANLESIDVNFNDKTEPKFLSSNYITQRLANIEKHFTAALLQKQQYKEFADTSKDAVTLLVEHSFKLPKEFVLRLLKRAESSGYNFAESYYTEEDRKYNLLHFAVDTEKASLSYAFPPLWLIEFLLNKGVNPFEEAYFDKDGEPIKLIDFFNKFNDILKSEDVNKITDFLLGLGINNRSKITPFELNLSQLQSLLDMSTHYGEPDKGIILRGIEARKEIIRLMQEKLQAA